MKNKITPKKILANIDITVTSIVMSFLVVLTFFGVVFRYALNRPIMWMEEVQLMCIVWVVYGAAGIAFRMKSHVAIEMLVDIFPHKLQKITHILISAVIIGSIAYMFIQSLGFVKLFIMNERVSSIIRIPYKYVYAIVPISCVLMIANHIYALYSSRVQRKQGE